MIQIPMVPVPGHSKSPWFRHRARWFQYRDGPNPHGSGTGTLQIPTVPGCPVPRYDRVWAHIATWGCPSPRYRGVWAHIATWGCPSPRYRGVWAHIATRGHPGLCPQRGNPVLKFIRNVPWEFGDIVPDYVLGQSSCALFLSLRYHHLNPDYIHERLRSLGRSFGLQVLLVQVDVVRWPCPCPRHCHPVTVTPSLSPRDPHPCPLLVLGSPSPSRPCPLPVPIPVDVVRWPCGCHCPCHSVPSPMSLSPPLSLCPHSVPIFSVPVPLSSLSPSQRPQMSPHPLPSPEEAGRYLETFKSYEQKPPDLLKERVEQDFLSRVTDCLTGVKSVNKTDALSLLGAFGVS
ncbi:PREDICTED: DNA excision repair protein ERCC-1, partial [Corvus brachyrhynchos]|uniref:DNA excision repair protein ERCC-1 n=1 Tax=Corvus brachyrhynchos TaxID=85066 RepID=UPI0008165782